MVLTGGAGGPRWLVVHLPVFRLERCGFGPDEPAGLVAEERNAWRVVAATPAARAEGIREGTTAAEARALLPEIELFPYDPEGEAADRQELLQQFGRLSDRIATLGPDDLLLEVSRTAHIFEGEPGIVAAAREVAERAGHRSHVAVAVDPVGAAAVARYHLGPAGLAAEIVARGGLRERLAPLPLAALGPSPELYAGLRAVGLRTIAELARLDAASVAGRWGEEAVRLHRIACGQAIGVPGTPPGDDGPVVVAAPLGGATTLAQLAFVLPGMLGELTRELGARDLAAVRLRIQLRLEHAAPLGITLRVGRPSRDPELLRKLVLARLENVKLVGAVSELVLDVVESAPALGWQPGLVDRTEATEPLPDLLARLMDTLGDAAVFVPSLADRWRPEAAWAPVSVAQGLPLLNRPPERGAGALPLSARNRGAVALAADPVEAQEQHAPRLPLPRPLVLLARPARIDVHLRDGRPAIVRIPPGGTPADASRPGSGSAALKSQVVRAVGPERLSGEWWRIDDPLERDYWAVDIGPGTAWIFQRGATWYLHGWFD